MASSAKGPNSTSNLLSTSVTSASSLVLLQLFSRIFTFGLNQALIRLASPQTFGTAAIQFELLLSTILFLCREGIRNALLRANTSSKEKRAIPASLVTNISLLPVWLGIPIAVLAAALYIIASPPSTTSQPYFHLCVALYVVAAFLELASEPLYIRAQNDLRFNIRIRAEGSAVVSKTVVTFFVLAFASSKWALVAFASGQVVYGMSTLASYVRVYGKGGLFRFQKVALSSHGKGHHAYFDRGLLHLSAAMTAQSVVKHFLTEGDKFLVSYISPLADQGGYALASNYGSLVARIMLQPIEETSRVFFSKTLSSSTESSKDDLRTAARILFSLLLLFTHLFLFLVTFGPPYLPLAISILIPSRYQATSAPLILRTYIYYIPTMAYNGLLEAFFASTATPADLRTQSKWMVLFSISFVMTVVLLVKGLHYGDTGFVWANIANLGVRGLYAWIFMQRYYAHSGAANMVQWRRALPPPSVFGVFIVSGVITRWSAKVYHGFPIYSQLGNVGVGVSCVICCLTSCYISQRAIFHEVATIMQSHK